MINAIETIAEAIPCNIVYGRKQAAQSIARALSNAGFTIMSKEEVEAVRDKALEEAARHLEDWGDMYGDNAARAIRALKSIPRKE